ncbi:MAG TPA: signal peptide peptidase SppA [Deltaproteobacteria bacterium]|nr:signal peptide peptidase SppA [Deltaproteobacteria bacterium]
MRKHPIIYGLLLMLFIGVVFLIVAYFVASLTGEKRVLSSKDKVGVVMIKGVLNESSQINDQLEEYDRDNNVKAIVIRIDSPGGSVVPAQEVYDKILEVKKNKNVLVSMGAVAASGGYYIASAAEKIVANPGTITGSIGVIAQFPQMKELLDKIGLKSTIIKSGKYKDTGSPTREMTSDEKSLIQGVVDDIYNQFVEVVSLNRKIPKADIEAIADGRIFTGRQALSLGLIDYLGNMEYTIQLAAQLSGIEGKPEVVYPKKKRKGIISYIFQEAVSTVVEELRTEQTGIQYIYQN